MSGGTATTAVFAEKRPSRLLPYAQLLRIPNVFTAIADIALAALVTGSLPGQWFSFLFLALSSSCLYCAGMVWNDYFDYEQDLRERPFRPLPSHRITRGTAFRLGVALALVGVCFAMLAGFRSDGFHTGPFILSGMLLTAILLYDAWLKKTFLGPISMGLCRFLNVLLGLTIADAINIWGFVLALVVGVYITGVTWFARREARISKQLELAAASVVMMTGLAMALFLPVVGTQLARTEDPTGPASFTFGKLGHILFPHLLVAYGFWIGIPAAAAIRNPLPKHVQITVKRAVMGVIVLDAILACSLAGTQGLLVLVLLPPALFLGKWVYST